MKYKLLKSMLLLVLFPVAGMALFYLLRWSQAGAEECTIESSISCDRDVYIAPLVAWASILLAVVVGNVILAISSRRQH